MEITNINLKEKSLELLDGEFGLSSHTTVYPSMGKVIDDRLFYITDQERKVRTINLDNMR